MNKYKCRKSGDDREWDSIEKIYKAFDEGDAAEEFAEWYDGWGSPGDNYMEVEVLNMETREEFIVQVC